MYLIHIHDVILYNIFNNLVHKTQFNGVEFTTCGKKKKKLKILGYFRFQILRLLVSSLYLILQ
jgi:hypothetical protein